MSTLLSSRIYGKIRQGLINAIKNPIWYPEFQEKIQLVTQEIENELFRLWPSEARKMAMDNGFCVYRLTQIKPDKASSGKMGFSLSRELECPAKCGHIGYFDGEKFTNYLELELKSRHIVEWLFVKSAELNAEHIKYQNIIDNLLHECTTVEQLLEVWPEARGIVESVVKLDKPKNLDRYRRQLPELVS